MTLKATGGYKWEIDGERVSREAYATAKKQIIKGKFDEYSYRQNGELVIVTQGGGKNGSLQG